MQGFLTRTITGYDAHDDAGHSEYEYDYNSSFHMIKVPCILPKMSEIAIAEMNMPVMIHTMSIISVPICPRVLPRSSR